MFKFYLFLAYLGFFKYEGYRDCGTYIPSVTPRARVLYPDGNYSVPMAIGNAVDYSGIFGGQVVPHKIRK